jgi:competence protein ComEC
MAAFHLQRRPAIALCASFIGGVAVAGSSVLWPLAAAAGSLAALAMIVRSSKAPIIHALCCVAALACGFLAEKASSAEFAARMPVGTKERQFRGRLLALPEIDSEGRRRLLLEGREMTVLLTVAGDHPLQSLKSGDRLSVWCRLVRPRGYVNPGSSDPAIVMRARGLHAVGSVKSALLVRKLGEGRSVPRLFLDEAKLEARRRLDAAFGENGTVRTVMGAMLLGDRAALAPDLNRTLRNAGLIHLIAISGLHVGVMAMVLFGTLRRSRMPAWALFAAAFIVLPAFALFVGARPPVARAACGALLVLLGRWCGRDGDSLNSLAMIACLLVALDPGVMRSPSFQLTFMATAGILMLSAPLAAVVPLPKPAAMGAAVSVSAYVAGAPLVACHFGWLAPVAIPLNLAAAPLCALVLGSGYATVVLGGMPVLGGGAARLGELAVSCLMHIATEASELDISGWRVGPPGLALTACYYALLLAIALWSRAGRRPRGILIVTFAALLIWIHLGPPPQRPGRVTAAILDVGQSQAAVVRGAGDVVMMVDASGGTNPRFDPGERIVLPLLTGWGIRRVDVLVVSHGHLDHAGGAFAVLRELEVGELWLGPGFHRDAVLAGLAAHGQRSGATLVLARSGAATSRGELLLEVLAPEAHDDALSSNDSSVVVRIGEAPHRLLIPGDLESAGEMRLVRSGLELRAEALVAPHHGASGSSSAPFLEKVAPRHAVVSCGFANRFGHPHPEMVRRMERGGAVLWRTDRDGMVLLEAVEGGWKLSATRR